MGRDGESVRNWKWDEYKWWQSLKASGLNFWWMDRCDVGGESTENEIHKVTPPHTLGTRFESRGCWDIMSSGGVVWVELLSGMKACPPQSMAEPRLLRHYNTWHKRTADFIISWSCPQRLFCASRAGFNVPEGDEELREPWEKIEKRADSVGAW